MAKGQCTKTPLAQKIFWGVMTLVILIIVISSFVFESVPEWQTDRNLELNSRMFTRIMIVIMAGGIGYAWGFMSQTVDLSSGMVHDVF